MGWFVWVLETLASLAAGYFAAVAAFPRKGAAERAVATLLVSLSLVLCAIESCGVVDRLEPVTLALVAALLFAATSAIAIRVAGMTRVREVFASDVRLPARTAVEAWREREVGLGTIVTAGLAASVVLTMVWFFRSWTWDPVWYHVPITSYAIQEHSLRWMDTHNPYVAGYPRNVELIAAWNCIFPHDNRFDDSPQLPFALLGMAVVAAWARRVGASRPLALALGAAWFALPPVFLQAHSSHVDIACGALLTAAAFYVSDENTAASRWMCLLALGLYVGTKFSGIFHLVALAPVLAVRAVLELWRAREKRLRTFGNIVLSVGAFAAVGLHKYGQNALRTGNPLWPFQTKVPLVDHMLPGPEDVSSLYGGAPGARVAFWGLDGDFQHMLNAWFDPSPFFAPDVRGGGFGPAFRWLLLPCVIIVLADLVRGREWRKALPVIALFAVSIVVPAAYWPRYTIGAASASLVAFAMVHRQLPRRWLRVLASAALVALVAEGYRAGYAGFIAYPKHFEAALHANWLERSALNLDTFLWPTEAGLLRERELRAGDVVTYDDAAHFLGEFFCRDYRTRVMFVPSAGDPQAYLARVRALHARWVGVRRGTAAEAAIRGAGAQFLFTVPPGNEALYRMPR